MSPPTAFHPVYKLFYILLATSSVLGAGIARSESAVVSSLSLPTPEITGGDSVPTLVPRVHVVKITRNHKTHTVKKTRSHGKAPTPTSTPGPVVTTISGVVTTVTPTPKPTPSPTPTGPPPPPPPPPPPAHCEHSGCFGSAQSFPDYHLVESTRKMTTELCTSECTLSGFVYSGLHKSECYCATTLGSEQVEVPENHCDAPCPGLKSEFCGGKDIHGPHVKNGKSPRSMIFDIYSCSTPSTTTSSTTSQTSSSAPDPSADMGISPHKERGIEELLHPAKPLASRDYTRLARGGILKAAEAKQQGNVLVKKDFGIKKSWWSKD